MSRGTPQPSRRQPAQRQPVRRAGWSTGFVVFVLVIGMLFGAGGLYGFQWYQKNFNQPASVAYPKDPDFRSPDGSILLNHTNEVDGATVQLTPDKKAIDGINRNPRLAFKAISTPTDIAFLKDGKNVNDDVSSDKATVTLKYNPKLIPKGLTSRQVGMVVYDKRLQSWVPILNAVADPATNTVTARAPHFSWFSAIVLDPLQKSVEAAGKTIQSTVTNVMTVADWMWQVTQQLTGELVNDLTGTPPALNCSSANKKISVETNSTLGKLRGCAQPAGDNDTLKLSNGFAFPMLTKELPKGVTLNEQDVWDNGASLPDLIRSLYWTSQNRAYISGAKISSVTVTPDMQKTATIGMDLDSDALSFDIGLAVLSFMAPEAEPAKKAVHSVLETVIKNGTVNKAQLNTANSWVLQSYNYADCAAGASHDLDEQPFSGDSTNTAANVAHDCLSSIFDQLDLKGALADLLSSLKTIPATIQSLLYTTSAAVLDTLPTEFDSIKMHAPTASVTRIGTVPAPTKEDTPKATPTTKAPKQAEGNWGNYKSLIGTWKASVTTIVIDSKGYGTYSMDWGKCTDNYDAGTLVNCKVKGNIAFIPATPSIADWGVPKATNLDTGKNQPLTSDIVAKYKGQASTMTRSSDGHSIIIDGGPYAGLEFCDSYMMRYSNDPNSPHWGRCDGNP